MALTQEKLEYQREYRRITKGASDKKYYAKISNNFEMFVKYSFTTLRQGALKRNLSFRITISQLRKLLLNNPRCALSGRHVTYTLGCPNKASVDRIDNRYGYSINNLQVVTAGVNFVRNDSTVMDFIALAKDVVKTTRRGAIEPETTGAKRRRS